MPDRSDVYTQDNVNRQWTYQTNGQASNQTINPTNGHVYSDNSLADLLTGLTTDLSTLLRQEVELAKVETIEKVSHASKSIIMMAAGGSVLYAGFLVFLGALVGGISALFSISLWLSALIVAVLVLAIGAILLQSGRSTLQQVNVVPEKTVETIKENVDMIKEKTS
jgi:uncharacterized membrane protein